MKRYWDQVLEEAVARLEDDKVLKRIALQQVFEERRKAYELSRRRELHQWTTGGGCLLSTVYAFSAYERKNMLIALPIIPILGYVLYEADSCYYGKRDLIGGYLKGLIRKPTKALLPVSLEDLRRRQVEIVVPSKLDKAKLDGI